MTPLPVTPTMSALTSHRRADDGLPAPPADILTKIRRSRSPGMSAVRVPGQGGHLAGNTVGTFHRAPPRARSEIAPAGTRSARLPDRRTRCFTADATPSAIRPPQPVVHNFGYDRVRHRGLPELCIPPETAFEPRSERRTRRTWFSPATSGHRYTRFRRSTSCGSPSRKSRHRRDAVTRGRSRLQAHPRNNAAVTMRGYAQSDAACDRSPRWDRRHPKHPMILGPDDLRDDEKDRSLRSVPSTVNGCSLLSDSTGRSLLTTGSASTKKTVARPTGFTRGTSMSREAVVSTIPHRGP
jgi:hypothetical protein